jgi:CBS-domain-containing membrane protein
MTSDHHDHLEAKSMDGSAPLVSLLNRLGSRLHAEQQRGRSYQPRFSPSQVASSWLGALLSLGLLAALSVWSDHPLMAAPLGASSVLLFGHPRSPLAQPRNIILGNGLGALIAVLLVGFGWYGPWAIAVGVGLTLALGQQCRCLHPPAGGIAFLGVFLKAGPVFLVFPVLSGSVLLALMAWQFSRRVKTATPYPVHWL